MTLVLAAPRLEEPQACADIVRDEVSTLALHEAPPGLRKPLRPGMRGSRSCVCRGEVLVLLGNYGWISPLDAIAHPATALNGGRVYVHWYDTVGQSLIDVGSRVIFYLYVDSEGLGAELCGPASDAEEWYQALGAESEVEPMLDDPDPHPPPWTHTADFSSTWKPATQEYWSEPTWGASHWNRPAARPKTKYVAYSQMTGNDWHPSSNVGAIIQDKVFPSMHLVNDAYFSDETDDDSNSGDHDRRDFHEDSLSSKSIASDEPNSTLSDDAEAEGEEETRGLGRPPGL
mmetsp:Transcript_54256/g.117332  ORF Transcript_54256/g.117332 Transcript_54256/m.117332 type:complete len:287 (-) Transcript_54256:28-888(-)